MMRAVVASFVVAACGAGSSPKPAATVADPAPMPPPATDPAPTPAEPVPDVEPAPPDPAKVRAELLAAEIAAYEQARPVFEKYCASCHSKDGKKQSAKKRSHFDMTTYPFGGHHAMDISHEIRKVLGVTGKKPTMPPNRKGIVRGEELERIKAWADAFDAAHAGGAHEGYGGGHAH